MGAQAAMAACARPRATLDQVVEGFDAREATVVEICKFLFNRDHLIIGLELIQPASQPNSVDRRISASFGPAPLRAILDAVVALDPEFVWIEDSGVANLVRRENLQDPNYLVVRRLGSFDAEDLPYDRALTRVMYIQYKELGGLPAGGGLRHHPDEGPRVTMHLTSPTVREVLNDIAWQAGLGWLVQFSEGDSMMGFVMAARFSLSSEECSGCPAGSQTSPVITTIARGFSPAEAPGAAESLVALREQLAPRGFGFIWDAAARRVSVVKARQRVTLAAGDTRATVNGVPVTLPAAPVLNDGRLLVPPVLVALALGRGPRAD
jgi:hypothetical protein